MAAGTRIEKYFKMLPRTGFTPFHLAVQVGNTAVVLRCLQECGGDANFVDVRDRGGLTPLEHAIHFEQYSIGRLLLEHGADGNADLNGFTLYEHVAIGEMFRDYRLSKLSDLSEKEIERHLKRNRQSLQKDIYANGFYVREDL